MHETFSQQENPSENEKERPRGRGSFDIARRGVNKIVAHELPKSGYESTMKVYGGHFAYDKDGKMVYDPRDAQSYFVDIPGDRALRTFDEHYVKNPKEMKRRHPEMYRKFSGFERDSEVVPWELRFHADAKRYRGTMEDTERNIKKFGLEDYYGRYEFPADDKYIERGKYGIEVKQPEVFKNAVGLQDIFRADKIAGAPDLKKIDRFDALGKASDYMRELHEKTNGGIAEGNAYMFMFTEKNDDEVGKPILMIPTEIYNPEKRVPAIEQKSTDFLDFLASTGFEEYRRAKAEAGPVGKKGMGELAEAAWASVRKALRIALEHYGDKKVISITRSFIKRGRLTLTGDAAGREHEESMGRFKRSFFEMHNNQRLTVDPKISAQLRKEIEAACDEYLASQKETERSEKA